MSVRDRENENKNCPSRGLGLAAAAIGVGVGAALYYFFSKRPENPADEGSTSSFRIEDPHVLLNNNFNSSSSSSYTTISEHSTSDTSIAESIMSTSMYEVYQHRNSSDPFSTFSYLSQSYSSDEMNRLNFENEEGNGDTEISVQGHTPDFDSSIEFASEFENEGSEDAGSDQSVTSNPQSVSDLDWEIPSDSPSDVDSDWVDSFSLDTPAHEINSSFRSPLVNVFALMSQIVASRNRSWTLEECSICFEAMQMDQEVLPLACSHRFHQACIMPWLQEQQTCPNCRKAS